MEELKKAILEFAETNKKSKFYFSDMEKGVKKIVPTASTRDIKKAATALVGEEKLIYFSTGSSTMYGLKGRGQTEDH
ncbi:MAG: sulfite reductase [Desulfobacteraceae bacterium]|nr:MAG: sulfite reductase [Desulfobacteraceae bacterium]